VLAEVADLRRRVADLEALVRRLVSAGEVVERDPAGQRVRVRLPAEDDVHTAWLPVLTHRARGTRHFSCPDIGEQVYCLFMPAGAGLETGAVLGSAYNDSDGPPSASGDVWRTEFADGGYLDYDAAAGSMQIHAVGDLVLTAGGNVQIQAGGDMASDAAGSMSSQAGGSLSTSAGGAQTHASTGHTIQAPTHIQAPATIDGAIAIGAGGGGGSAVIAGDLIAQGDVQADSGAVRLRTHVHEDVEPGGGDSGPPKPGT
jgi:phage baseplate assembly protein V